MRMAVLVLAAGASALLLAPPMPAPPLLWNATSSAPRGLWAVEPGAPPQPGDWAAATPPPKLAGWLSARGYLPSGGRLLKRVLASEGQVACRDGAEVRLDGRLVAVARRRDRRGRPLPAWRGCRRLRAGEALLVNAAPDSLDSRYFGPLPPGAVMGRARPLVVEAAR